MNRPFQQLIILFSLLWIMPVQALNESGAQNQNNVGAKSELLKKTHVQENGLTNKAIIYYIKLIHRKVRNNWIEPQSSKEHFEAIVLVNLSRSGEIVNVKLESSNGSPAFKHSVIKAVVKAISFPEVAELRDEDFNKYFKSFKLHFRSK